VDLVNPIETVGNLLGSRIKIWRRIAKVITKDEEKQQQST